MFKRLGCTRILETFINPKYKYCPLLIPTLKVYMAKGNYKHNKQRKGRYFMATCVLFIVVVVVFSVVRTNDFLKKYIEHTVNEKVRAHLRTEHHTLAPPTQLTRPKPEPKPKPEPAPEPKSKPKPAPETLPALKPASKPTKAESIALDIRTGMQRAFQAYMRDAWKADEYMPVQKRGTNTFGGKGLTIIDSLDTLYLMGLQDEFNAAQTFVENDFRFEGHINVFENNIRVLGGLLSAYVLTDKQVFLTKAKEVGEVLLRAFPQRIPCGVIDTRRPGYCGSQSWAGGKSINAEIGTLSLEFVTLSKLTGDARWSRKIDALHLYWKEHDSNLLQMNIDPRTEQMSGPATIGGGIDSTYEYLNKMHIMTGDALAGDLYKTFEKMIVDRMFVKYGDTVFAKAAGSDDVEHLGCFVGGMLLLGQRESSKGLGFTETCAKMYTSNPSGIACDKVRIQHDGGIHCVNDIYLLRPEVVESIFYAWRFTHDQKWRDYAEKIWKAIAKHCEVPTGGFTDVRHVTRAVPEKLDKQESWFLAETMKYLWLVFQPDEVLPLDQYVFNTECHPLKIW